MPFDEFGAERLGDFNGEDRFAGAGFPLDQERTLQSDRGIDGHFQIFGGDVILGAFKAHELFLIWV